MSGRGRQEKWVVVETERLMSFEDILAADPILEKRELAEFDTVEEAEKYADEMRLRGLHVKVASSIDPWRLAYKAWRAAQRQEH